MNTPPSHNPSLHDLAAALDNDGELPSAPLPNPAGTATQWPDQVATGAPFTGGSPSFPPEAVGPAPLPATSAAGWQMVTSIDSTPAPAPHGAPPQHGNSGVTIEELPLAIRHLDGKIQRLESEHLPQLRQRAVPGCPGCNDYDDSYRGLLRHLVALEEAAVVAVKTLKTARGRYSQAMREAFTEQADRFENLADQARSIDSLSDAEQANLIPTFANDLRHQTMQRAESLAESKRSELKNKLDIAKRDRDHLRQQLDTAAGNVNRVNESLRTELGVSPTMLTKYFAGEIDLGNLLANVVGNAGGAVKLNSLHAAIWIGTDQPQGPVGHINAAPTTLNSALGGDAPSTASAPAPAAAPPPQPQAKPSPHSSNEPPTLRPPKADKQDMEKKRPPVVSATQAPGSKDVEQETKIKALLKILSRRGVVSAKSIARHSPIADGELKELVLVMNRAGAGISWLAAEGDALLAATASFMPYYENWFEKFNDVDEAHKGYLGWTTTHKMLDQTQISAIAPVLSTLLAVGWLVGYPVRFQGVSGAKAPVGLHLIRPGLDGGETQNSLLLYVPSAKSAKLPKAVTTQSFDVTFLHMPSPSLSVLPENLKPGVVYGIKKTPGVASDTGQWQKLNDTDQSTTP